MRAEANMDAAAPPGLFDRQTVGQATTPQEIHVDRASLIRFAEVIGETDPVFLSVKAARAAGHPDVVAPPTYAAVIDMAAMQDAARAGVPDVHALIRADFRYLLHGEETYHYHGPIHAGDRLYHQTTVLGFSDAGSGRMELARLETVIRHPDRGPLVTCQRTLVHRLDTGAGR
ncbi:MaoC family dehydratase N-terminal domain-containing protein [Mameliella alba]|nr:MaoC family dehydratase N-terminal domain-containing protein [Mameliella alba]